jgi:hypothetical protein
MRTMLTLQQISSLTLEPKVHATFKEPALQSARYITFDAAAHFC